MDRFVYDFSEGGRDQADLLGGKGANLAEMTRLGLPVPAGFTVTTDACREYLRTDSLPAGLGEEIALHLRRVESAMGRPLRRPRPTRCCCRCGRAPVLDAGHDGDHPRHRPQRRHRRGPGRGDPATSASRGTRTAG